MLSGAANPVLAGLVDGLDDVLDDGLDAALVDTLDAGAIGVWCDTLPNDVVRLLGEEWNCLYPLW